MELRRYLSIIRRRLLLVVLIIAAGLAGGYLITPRADEYTATSMLYVGSGAIDIDPRAGQVSGNYYLGLDRLISTFTAMMKSEPVSRDAIERADVDRTATTVSSATKPEQLPNTNLIAVSVSDRDPTVAAALSNGVARAFVEQINNFEPGQQTATSGSTQQVADVFQRAELPESPDSTSLMRNMILGGLFGLVVAGAAVALLEHLDITLRSSEDVERRLELPVLGVVPALGDALPVNQASRVRTLPAVRRSPAREDTTVG